MTAQAEQNRQGELSCLATEVGERALDAFRQFTREQISAAELQARLRELEAGSIMASYWDLLTSSPENVPCFEILQLLDSLGGEMEYQVERYGESSLWDDLEELQRALRRIRG